MENDPRTAQSGGPCNVSLVRCRACGRAEECSPTDVAAHIRAGGAACCGRVMDLFVQVAWPGGASAILKMPPPRPAASGPPPGPPTGQWNPAAGPRAPGA